MIDGERRAGRGRFRARREGRTTERVNAFSVEEFEAHHGIPDPGSVPSQETPTEPLEVHDAGVAESGERVADSLDGGDPDEPRDVVRLDDPAEMLPALAGVAADLGVRALIWGFETSLHTGARLARAATDPQAAAELYQDVTSGLRSYAREFLGITDLDEQLRELKPLAGATLPQNGRSPESTLREQGARLLRQAADVSFDEGVHPAFARILTELAPDEARILRILAIQGPQPMVDVRETNLIGVGSQLVSSGLNMIGAQAGLRYRDRVDAYLGNLLRLGLIEFSDEAAKDPIAYQVLEAQPEVLGTIKETPRAKTVHRSVRLTPFGEGFCRICLPLELPSLPSGETAQDGHAEESATSVQPEGEAPDQ